eukprot:344913-Pelagomonas_calceolata.AAC.4
MKRGHYYIKSAMRCVERVEWQSGKCRVQIGGHYQDSAIGPPPIHAALVWTAAAAAADGGDVTT